MNRSIDLNCDMGEIPELIRNGSQDALMDLITSVNVACGAHAGDDETMESTLRAAKKKKVAAGAHPGYPDRDNFGRLPMILSPAEIESLVFNQLQTLGHIARRVGIPLGHLKPHGALYNVAARDESVARAIAKGAAKFSRELYLVGLAGSSTLAIYEDEGFRVAGEAFADRAYESDGSLRSRKRPGAVYTDPLAASQQAVQIVSQGTVRSWDGKLLFIAAKTICIHGDTAHAADLCEAIVRSLRENNISLAPPDVK